VKEAVCGPTEAKFIENSNTHKTINCNKMGQRNREMETTAQFQGTLLHIAAYVSIYVLSMFQSM
jgi:hypothetical protein